MISPVYARLRSITIEGFRVVDMNRFVVAVLIKWVSTDGAIEVERAEVTVDEPLENTQWHAARALVMGIGNQL